MKTKERISILFRGSKQTLHFMTLIALLAMSAAAYLMVPTINNSGTVSAQAQAANSEAHQAERATPEMLAYALNFQGNLGDSLNAFNQLPCTELSGAELGGRTLEPGVYCLESARLAGELVLDGQNDASSVFVFVVKGSINVENRSTISLRNHAQAANAIFIANDSVTVRANSEFNARILANNDIQVENGATVLGNRLMSVKGEISAPGAPDGGGTGTLQICKAQVVPTGGTSLANRIFNFTVSTLPGVVIPVPVGGCSGQIDVPAGAAVVTELNTGQLISPPSGTFTGNFQLIGVNQLSTNPQPGSSSLGLVNLSARTAAINIVEGGVPQQLTLEFVNQFAITGFVEICKRAAALPTGVTTLPSANGLDPDVTGFFTFNIEGVFTTNTQNPTERVLQNFVAPVGGCTGPISVTISNPVPVGNPASSIVRVSELGRAGVFLESVDTIPVDRETAPEVLNSRVNANGAVVANPGGGFATVRVFEAVTSANETLINFRNRTSSRVKVCKIAGPGITANTPFTFTVSGTTFGATPGTFAPVTRTLTVLAGPANVGGFCDFVPDAEGTGFQNFVPGTDVLVTETAPLTIGGNQVRTSRIRVTPGGAATVPSVDLVPVAGVRVSRAFAFARSEVIEFEFTNFVFNPAPLKICKIAGTNVAVGTPFTFNIAFVSPTGQGGDLFPAQTATVTVLAGPAAQGGFCTTVDTPVGNFLGGALNAGSTVTITEAVTTPATTVAAISSPTSTTIPTLTTSGGGLFVETGARRATLIGVGGLQAGVTVNTVTFTNNAAGTTPSARAAFDFDGDGKSDLSVFRPAVGTWYVDQSQNGFVNYRFGADNDRIVPADYDGDGKTDYAVFRDGIWYMQRSTSGFEGVQFGQSTDIPMPADYDGDGRADIAVFRPSNGVWYIQRSQLGFTGIVFGQNGDRPVAADYDNDGKADVAVYRNGIWYIQGSQAGFSAVQFGTADDRPVPADYDGDGKSDVAVFRPSNGTWYLMGSTAGFSGVAFGTASDTASPADYDGDGKADIAYFRQSTGTWHVIRSTAGSMTKQFGMMNDKSVPNAFVR
jgi:hypothetical protein